MFWSLAVVDVDIKPVTVTCCSQLEWLHQLPANLAEARPGEEGGDGGVGRGGAGGWSCSVDGGVMVVVGTDGGGVSLLPGGEVHHGDSDGVTGHRHVTD